MPMTVSNSRRSVAPRSAVASRAAAVLGAAAAKLSVDQQKRLVRHEAAVPDLVARVLAQLDQTNTPSDYIVLSPLAPSEVSQGEGLGEPLAPAEGRRRLHDYATPMTLEDWAGATAGPVEIERALHIPRSTLHAWRSKGLVLGLLNGLRKTVYPLDQFVDGKPVAGLANVMGQVGEPRTTWRWLKEAHPLLGGTAPLALLKCGRLDDVLLAARANFGQ